MLSRSSRGRPLSAPAVFHLSLSDHRQAAAYGAIHVRDGRVRLYSINGTNWSKRYPLMAETVAHIQGSAILDAEVIWLDSDGMAQFDALHRRVNDGKASVCAFNLLMLNGEDLRRKPYVERKAVLRKLLRQGRGIQYVEHAECHGTDMDTPYRSGPSKAWIKVKSPKAPAVTRVLEGAF